MYGKVSLNLEGFEILEKTASKFGNGAHIVLSKHYKNSQIKIIAGRNLKIKKGELIARLFDIKILDSKITNFGTGIHALVPKEYTGRKIKLILEKNG